MGRRSGKEGHCLRSPGVWSSRDARGSFRAAGACPWLASALTARGTASPARHTGLCLGWHRWPGRTTVGRKRRKSESWKERDTSVRLGSRGKPGWSPVRRGHGPYRAAAQVLKPQLVRQLAHRHGVGHVLLVGKHQQHRVPKLILLQLRGEGRVGPRGSRLPGLHPHCRGAALSNFQILCRKNTVHCVAHC